MRVVQKPNEADSLERLVLTGDGRAERRRLEAVASKYDGEKELFLPSSGGGTIEQGPLRYVGTKKHNNTTLGDTGTDVIDGIRERIKDYDEVLFVVDAEHFRDDPKGELTTKFESLNWDAETERLGASAYEFSLTVGSTRVRLYAAIVGDRFECFEDGIAALIECRRDISRRSIYNDVADRDDLKEQIEDILDDPDDRLLREAPRHEIDDCLPALAAVLRQFE
jgi:hypothetical protein